MSQDRALSPLLQQTLTEWLGLQGLPERDPARFQALCRSVADLSRLFTKDRADMGRSYLDEEHLRAGYLAYFLPVNIAKVQSLLDELPALESGERPITVLDVGSGPGTGALAALDWLQQQPGGRQRAIEVTAVDRSKPALRDAEQLWTAYMRPAHVQSATLVPLRVDLEKGRWLDELRGRRPEGFDLILAANVLSEVGDGTRDAIERRTALAEGLLGVLAPHGALIIVEPALRSTSRSLHHVRDRLLAQRVCTVYSPCLHDHPCPALIKEDDWCHEERSWTPPSIVSAIDREVGFIKDALKFSYVILRKDGQTIVPRQPDMYRVVSELREMKGEKRAWLCNETGRPEVGRLERERSEANAAVDEWHRGAIVRIDQIVRKERKGRESTVGRIGKESTVEIVRPV
ncbi:MAG: small ribosomal subunit Rsm22 family protein [Nitrospiraceae bacterium]